jgi:hypothetical protein
MSTPEHKYDVTYTSIPVSLDLGLPKVCKFISKSLAGCKCSSFDYSSFLKVKFENLPDFERRAYFQT